MNKKTLSALSRYRHGEISLIELLDLLLEAPLRVDAGFISAVPTQVLARLIQKSQQGATQAITSDQASETETSPRTTPSPIEQEQLPQRDLVNRRHSHLRSKIRKTTKWLDQLATATAARTLESDSHGDWLKDPWGLTEVSWLAGPGRHHLQARLTKGLSGAALTSPIPRMDARARPAAILLPLERLAYQSLVGSMLAEISDRLAPWVFGWRSPQSNPSSTLARQDYQWANYTDSLGRAVRRRPYLAHIDVRSFFSSIDLELLRESLKPVSSTQVLDHTLQYLYAINRTANSTGIPQRCAASSILANRYLSTVDETAESAAKILGAQCVRWVDDYWCFSAEPHDKNRLEEAIRDSLQQLQLTHHTKNNEPPSMIATISGSPLEQAASPFLAHQATGAELSIAAESLTYPLFRDAVGRLASDPDEALALALDQPAVALRGASFLPTILRKHHLGQRLVPWLLTNLRTNEYLASNYLRAISINEVPPNSLISALRLIVADKRPNHLTVAAISRLASWDPGFVNELFLTNSASDLSPFVRRAVFLSLASDKSLRRKLRRFCTEDEDTYYLYAFTEASSPPRVVC